MLNIWQCKSVISRFQRRVDNDGHSIVPVIYDFWKNSSVFTTKKLLDPRKIGRRVESFKYNGVLDFISDVQLMLKNLAQHFDHTDEVRPDLEMYAFLIPVCTESCLLFNFYNIFLFGCFLGSSV